MINSSRYNHISQSSLGSSVIFKSVKESQVQEGGKGQVWGSDFSNCLFEKSVVGVEYV